MGAQPCGAVTAQQRQPFGRDKESTFLQGITTAGQDKELWRGAALNWLPVVIFTVLITAIINNTLCSSILLLKTQIAINILSSRQ